MLKALASKPGVQLGLETGNFREAAFIKLHRYGLDGCFEAGGFGGKHSERSQVVSSAIAECQTNSRQTYAACDVSLIGDSPADIEAGRANGIRTLAVATGFYSMEELAHFSPDHVLNNLSDTSEVLWLLLGT